MTAPQLERLRVGDVRGDDRRAGERLPDRHRHDPRHGVGPPAQLDIVGGKVLQRVTRKSKSIQIRVVIQACGGRAVQGAIVYAAAIPYNQFAAAEQPSAADGT